MKFRFAKILLVLTVLAHLSSCVIHKKTDRRSAGHAKYRRNGRFW